jgi:hypothetical protein
MVWGFDFQVAVDPNLFGVGTHGLHQPGHFVGAHPAAVVGKVERDARARRASRAGTCLHRIEELFCPGGGDGVRGGFSDRSRFYRPDRRVFGRSRIDNVLVVGFLGYNPSAARLCSAQDLENCIVGSVRSLQGVARVGGVEFDVHVAGWHGRQARDRGNDRNVDIGDVLGRVVDFDVERNR